MLDALAGADIEDCYGQAKNQESRRAQREAGMKNPGGKSNYAKKKAWLDRNGMWGFDVPSKPWKSS